MGYKQFGRSKCVQYRVCSIFDVFIIYERLYYIFLLIYRNDFSQKISLQRLKKINISKKSKISFSGLNVLAPPLFQIWYTQQ